MEQELKYLALNDWEEYQASIKNREWIKDSVGQRDRSKFASLSFFESGLLQELRRVRGRTGMNIENDVTHIALATHAKVTDRPHLRHALDTLISRKILILTNERLTPLEERRGDKTRGEEKVLKSIPEVPAKQPPKPESVSAETSSAVKAILYLPLNVGEFGIEESDFKVWKECYPAVDVMQELRKMAAWCHSNEKKRKTIKGVKRFINSWLSNAQDKFRPEAVSQNGQPKSEQREQRNNEKYARIEQRITGVPASAGVALPGGIGGGGNRDVDSRPKLLSIGRSSGSS